MHGCCTGERLNMLHAVGVDLQRQNTFPCLICLKTTNCGAEVLDEPPRASRCLLSNESEQET